MPTIKLRKYALSVACLATLCSTSEAALTISDTRVVHLSDKHSSSVVVANPSQAPYAVQAWVNTEADDTSTAVPFATSPTLFRLDPKREQLVKINALPNNLPTDRESLFYFNVQEIPQVDSGQQNVLKIALRTRIKLFYRPSQVKGVPEQHLDSLQWSLASKNGKTYLQVHNPTPYHFTFGRLEVYKTGTREKIDTALMALPMQKQSFELKATPAAEGLQVRFTTINDYGGRTRLMEKPLPISSI
ncbi:fimbrial biogenesis chaperone [Pseudomonas putida]|uniref:fimbrial biogenesis chaperone n=1 Tax=Pseudomonas putida TaxID=303 RepID=UPI00235C13A0|nr:molecular chaperone [Pseudomonas putida]GLO48545.1 chaperone protein PapD [Pseudomonas putida]HDS0982482.1 molecular chaperone [Pseudomonas putida]